MLADDMRVVLSNHDDFLNENVHGLPQTDAGQRSQTHIKTGYKKMGLIGGKHLQSPLILFNMVVSRAFSVLISFPCISLEFFKY